MTGARITVVGVGNPLKKDEGVGIRVVEELHAWWDLPQDVKLIDAGTMGPAMLPLFDECDLAIVVDAVDGTGMDPGTVVVMTPAQIAPSAVLHSLHDMRLVDVLAMAELTGRTVEAVVVGVQIEDMGGEASLELTAAVAEAVPRAARAVLDLLAGQGVVAVGRQSARPHDDSGRAIAAP